MKLNASPLLVAAFVALFPQSSRSAEIKVIAANAVKDGYTHLVETFEKSSGHKVITTWTGTSDATKRVESGEIYDLVIVGSDNIDRLIKAGKLAAGSRTDFAKTGVGVAVRAGLPKLDVSTVEALKAAILDTKSISYSAGPSGAYIVELLKKLGIAEQTAAKVKQASSGAEVAKFLARGEIDFGFAQVSEFLNVPGIVDLGPLPAAAQNFTIYAIGVHTASSAPDAAASLVKLLKSPEAGPAVKKMGMEPG